MSVPKPALVQELCSSAMGSRVEGSSISYLLFWSQYALIDCCIFSQPGTPFFIDAFLIVAALAVVRLDSSLTVHIEPGLYDFGSLSNFNGFPLRLHVSFFWASQGCYISGLIFPVFGYRSKPIGPHWLSQSCSAHTYSPPPPTYSTRCPCQVASRSS